MTTPRLGLSTRSARSLGYSSGCRPGPPCRTRLGRLEDDRLGLDLTLIDDESGLPLRHLATCRERTEDYRRHSACCDDESGSPVRTRRGPHGAREVLPDVGAGALGPRSTPAVGRAPTTISDARHAPRLAPRGPRARYRHLAPTCSARRTASTWPSGLNRDHRRKRRREKWRRPHQALLPPTVHGTGDELRGLASSRGRVVPCARVASGSRRSRSRAASRYSPSRGIRGRRTGAQPSRCRGRR